MTLVIAICAQGMPHWVQVSSPASAALPRPQSKHAVAPWLLDCPSKHVLPWAGTKSSVQIRMLQLYPDTNPFSIGCRKSMCLPNGETDRGCMKPAHWHENISDIENSGRDGAVNNSYATNATAALSRVRLSGSCETWRSGRWLLKDSWGNCMTQSHKTIEGKIP